MRCLGLDHMVPMASFKQFRKWLQLRNSGWRGPPPCQGSVESLGVPCQTEMVGSTLQQCFMELYQALGCSSIV